jgi:hypothetical protein
MKHIQSIYEWRNQLEIPFDNKHPLHDKPVHQHVLDVLHALDIKENPNSYKSTATIEQL